MLTFDKLKLSPKTDQKLHVNPVQQSDFIFPLSVGLLFFSWIGTRPKAWHMSLSLAMMIFCLGKFNQ